MPHKTDQEVNIKLEQIKALQNKLINHDNRSKFPFIKLLLQTSELIKMSARERHSALELLNLGRLHSKRDKLKESFTCKRATNLQKSIINMSHCSSKQEQKKEPNKIHQTAPATRSKNRVHPQRLKLTILEYQKSTCKNSSNTRKCKSISIFPQNKNLKHEHNSILIELIK